MVNEEGNWQKAQPHAGYIAQHALPVDHYLALMFSIGAYGESLLPRVEQALASDDCIVRSNAALAVSILKARGVPERLVEMAIDDDCKRARISAWSALGVQGEAIVASAALARLDAEPPPEKDELQQMLSGLVMVPAPFIIAPLEALAGTSDEEVRSKAEQALEVYRQNPDALGEIIGMFSRTSSERMRTRLERAVEEGRFEAGSDRDEFITEISAGDLELLNRLRLSVLRRNSDECISEYREVSSLMLFLRQVPVEGVNGSGS